MSEIEGLIAAYEQRVSEPWELNLAGQQKVWFAIYDPTNERRMRLRLQEFETATYRAHHTWRLVDITDSFAKWMANHEYREEYFRDPDSMDLSLADYADSLASDLRSELTADGVDEKTVVAIVGVGSLFGLTRSSELIDVIASAIRGRLLVFFPGRQEGQKYHLLDAGDGWNYLAVPISANDGK